MQRQRDVTLNDMLKEGELLSVLGTLAYAPEGVKAVLDGDDLKDDRYSVDAHLLYRGTLPLPLPSFDLY